MIGERSTCCGDGPYWSVDAVESGPWSGPVPPDTIGLSPPPSPRPQPLTSTRRRHPGGRPHAHTRVLGTTRTSTPTRAITGKVIRTVHEDDHHLRNVVTKSSRRALTSHRDNQGHSASALTRAWKQLRRPVCAVREA